MFKPRVSASRTLGAATLVFFSSAWVTSAQSPAASTAGAATEAAAPVVASPAPVLSDTEMERFLKEARIVKTKGTKKGVTGSTQATLSDGTLTHEAHIQTVDEFKREFRSSQGVEFDFRDSWMFNVAAYKLDRLIGLNMVPPSVTGRYKSARAAITWWIDDVLMDEADRLKKKIQAPNTSVWNSQMQLMRLFDELIGNVDRNMGNIIYTRDWRLWLIDHTRAFRKTTSLKHPAYVSRCDRAVFERLKALDRDLLKKEMGEFLDEGQIKGILARRDLIVQKLDEMGPVALFDRPQLATNSSQ